MALSIFQKVIGPLGPASGGEPHPVADARPGASPIEAGSPPCPDRNGLPFERWSSAARGLGVFFRSRRGSVGLETMLTVTVMLVLCGGLMAIAYTAYSQDRMDRAARAAARAVALLPVAVAADEAAVKATVCDVLRVEFDLDSGTDCDATWTITIQTGLTTEDLANGTSAADTSLDSLSIETTSGETISDETISDETTSGGPPPEETGEMILVRVGSGQAVFRSEPAS